jgi:hypothetical protein
MSKFCTPKVRSTFRKSRKAPGNTVGAIFYPDPNMKWKLLHSMVKAMLKNNAVQEKTS